MSRSAPGGTVSEGRKKTRQTGRQEIKVRTWGDGEGVRLFRACSAQIASWSAKIHAVCSHPVFIRLVILPYLSHFSSSPPPPVSALGKRVSGVLAWSCLSLRSGIPPQTRNSTSSPNSSLVNRSGPFINVQKMQVFCQAWPVILCRETNPRTGAPLEFSPGTDAERQGSQRCETIGWRGRVSTCTVLHVRDPDSTRQFTNCFFFICKVDLVRGAEKEGDFLQSSCSSNRPFRRLLYPRSSCRQIETASTSVILAPPISATTLLG